MNTAYCREQNTEFEGRNSWVSRVVQLLRLQVSHAVIYTSLYPKRVNHMPGSHNHDLQSVPVELATVFFRGGGAKESKSHCRLLDWWFSKGGLWTWKRSNTNSWLHSSPTESVTLEWGPGMCVLTSFPGDPDVHPSLRTILEEQLHVTNLLLLSGTTFFFVFLGPHPQHMEIPG